MRKVPSKTRRSLVIAGTAGLATLVAPQAWQTRLAQTVVSPAAAQEIPSRTNEIKVQYGHRKGRWGISAGGHNTIPLAIYNMFGEGTTPVVHEVQVHFRLDFPSVKDLSAELISPDGHSVMLLDRLGGSRGWNLGSCSTKGVDITFAEGPDVLFAPITPEWCPERGPGGMRLGSWIIKRASDKHMKGVFMTHANPHYRLLPQFNGRPAVGDWHLRVYNHLGYNVNKVIRQIDLTVYSKW